MQTTPSSKKSHLARNIGVVIVIVLLIGVGAIAYSYTQISGKITNVSYGGLVWAQPSASVILQLAVNALSSNWLGVALALITGINLNAQLSLTNNGIVPVGIPTETHDLVVNGIDLGSGSTNISSTVTPGQTITIPVTQTIETASISQLASSIVSSGGNLDIQINGQAHISMLGIPLSVPFQKSSQISLVQEIEQHVESLVAGQSSQQQTNQYNGNPSASGSVIVNGEYNVPPGQYTSIPFTLRSSAAIKGSFSATATLGNNIIVYILDQSNFALYQSGQLVSTIYNSGKVASGNIAVNLTPGTYYIILDNTYSTVSTKDVTIQVST